ncbi:MAG: V-type ATPase 116kDa subunit family protein [Syntrophales bacterium]|nr:V-type ATPase 116kDa subunit family protein [Syntrophales bacterium]
MFVKSDIRRVSIALEKGFYHEVSIELGTAGIMHLARFRQEESLAEEGLKNEEGKTRELLSGIENLLRFLSIDPSRTAVPGKESDMERDSAFVAETLSAVNRLQRLRSRIDEETGRLAEKRSCLSALRSMGIDPERLHRSRFMNMAFGTLEDREWMPSEKDAFIAERRGDYIFVAAMPADLPAMNKILKEKGFVDKSREVEGPSMDIVEKRLETLSRRKAVLEGYRVRLKEGVEERLLALLSHYRRVDEIIKSLRMSLFSSRAMFITGWMDIRDRDRLMAILKRVCGDRFVVNIAEERDSDAPVRLRNMAFFRPFELLVKTMGIPSNDEIDPTPLAAISFIVIFSIMFGDLGQGLTLAFLGYVLRRVARKKGMLEGPFGQAGGVMMICGFGAAFCGLLFGSVFSHEHLIPALVFHPIDNIMTLFAFTILMGAVIICTGFIVNIINALMNRNYEEALLEKHGLVILVPYIALVLFAVRYVSTDKVPVLWETIIFIIIPVVLFFLRGILGPVLFKSHPPHSLVEYFVESTMETFELAISMLANTISFIRVGAFALSHAGLGIVTYTLAGMVDPSLRSPGAIAVIVAGNIFIIGFEGLICGIQSLRLEYYEFFSKFFKGDGVVFEPFKLKLAASEELKEAES